MRKVEVVPYSEEWKQKFEDEKRILHRIFGTEVIKIHHIGSTSVMGLHAKPVIDIMPIVKDITQMDAYNEAMMEAGYDPKGENGLPGRRYFQKGGDQRTHHVHIYEKGNSEIHRHLVFRDYLRTHLEAAYEYGTLKETLAKKFPFDIQLYINGKELLVREIEQKAIQWSKTVEASNFHRAYGVYGICVQDGKLLAIHKNGGPYINRFDLPGGSLEERESLVTALKREFLEETGFEVEITKGLGTTDFLLSTDWRGSTDVHHIAVYYLVKQIGGNLIVPEQFEGQDSLGAVWISEKEVSIGNASPLVLKAFEWIKTNELGLDANYYPRWEVLK